MIPSARGQARPYNDRPIWLAPVNGRSQYLFCGAALVGRFAASKKNLDAIDVNFGPKAPADKESNWVPTDPKRRFELLFRLYGAKKEFFEMT